MHMAHPDFVSLKTAVRQMSVRLETEAAAAEQWSSLAEHRGVGEASELMGAVAGLLREACEKARSAGESFFEAQEESAQEHHHH